MNRDRPQDRSTSSPGELQGVHVDRVTPYNPDAHTLRVRIVASSAKSIEALAVSKFEMLADADHKCAFDSASVQGIKGGVAIQLTGKLELEARDVRIRAEVFFNGDTFLVDCRLRQRTAEERAKLNPDVLWEYVTSELTKGGVGTAESKPSK